MQALIDFTVRNSYIALFECAACEIKAIFNELHLTYVLHRLLSAVD